MVTSQVLARRHLVLSDLIAGGLVRDVALVLGGAGITGALAQLSVPVHGSPVPITGQTLGALLVGTALGWRRGIASLATYLLAGAAGLPWFADHSSGWDAPSFGYVIGFVVAAGIVGALAGVGGDRTPLRVVATMIVGNLVIYAFGVPYLMADLHVGLSTAWDIGVKNYLFGDGIKILIAAGVLPLCWRAVGSRSGR